MIIQIYFKMLNRNNYVLDIICGTNPPIAATTKITQQISHIFLILKIKIYSLLMEVR